MEHEDPAILAELSELAQGLAAYLREADQVDRLLSERLINRLGGWPGLGAGTPG